MSNSVHAYYDLMLNASRLAVKRGRRSRMSKQSVVNATSNFRYYVPNQWQGNFDQYIEVSRMWEAQQQHFIIFQLILNALATQVAVVIEAGQDNQQKKNKIDTNSYGYIK